MKKKLTIPMLRFLKKKRDESRDTFNKADEKLQNDCRCPPQFMRTESSYETDTLGSNGKTRYYDFCSVCGKSHGNYGGVYGGYDGDAKYPEAKQRDFR